MNDVTVPKPELTALVSTHFLFYMLSCEAKSHLGVTDRRSLDLSTEILAVCRLGR